VSLEGTQEKLTALGRVVKRRTKNTQVKWSGSFIRFPTDFLPALVSKKNFPPRGPWGVGSSFLVGEGRTAKTGGNTDQRGEAHRKKKKNMVQAGKTGALGCNPQHSKHRVKLREQGQGQKTFNKFLFRGGGVNLPLLGFCH